jgi:hypothetical protein
LGFRVGKGRISVAFVLAAVIVGAVVVVVVVVIVSVGVGSVFAQPAYLTSRDHRSAGLMALRRYEFRRYALNFPRRQRDLRHGKYFTWFCRILCSGKVSKFVFSWRC